MQKNILKSGGKSLNQKVKDPAISLSHHSDSVSTTFGILNEGFFQSPWSERALLLFPWWELTADISEENATSQVACVENAPGLLNRGDAPTPEQWD